MADLDAQIADLREQIDEVTKRNVRAEFERDAAVKAKAEALKVLAEFDCANEKEATKLLNTMEKDLQAELVRIQKALDE